MDDKNQFITLERKRVVTFDNDGKKKIIDIDNILLVDRLKYNLLSISQLCDKIFRVTFESFLCIISRLFDDGTKFIRYRHGNTYMVDLDEIAMKSGQYLIAMDTKIKRSSWLWHCILGHASLNTISKLITKDLVKGLSKLNFEKDRICDVCQYRKQTRRSFKSKNMV